MDEEMNQLVRRIRLVIFDFDGVFTDNFVYVQEDGREMLRFWRGDGIGLEKLKKMNVDVMILSTEENSLVSSRSRKLQVPCVQGVRDKGEVLERILREKKIKPAQVAYVGNDINDRSCLQRVGLPIVVQDAHADVLSFAKLRTRAKGGRGAVREVCDLFGRVLETEPASCENYYGS